MESHAAAVLGSHGRSCLREPPSPGRLPYDPVGRSSTRSSRARIVHIVPRWVCKRRYGGHRRRILRRSGGLRLHLDCELSRPSPTTQPTRSAPAWPTGPFPSVGRCTAGREVPEHRRAPRRFGWVCRARLCRARHGPSARSARAGHQGSRPRERAATGVRGQRKRAGRGAPEHWTGPRYRLTPRAPAHTRSAMPAPRVPDPHPGGCLWRRGGADEAPR